MDSIPESQRGIEAGFADLEAQLADAERRAQVLHAAVRKLLKAAHEGTVRPIADGLAQARGQAGAIVSALEAIVPPTGDDIAAAFRDGRYLADLKTHAAEAGLGLIDRDGRISAYPLMLRLDSGAQAVRVGRRMERRIRPSFLVGVLRAIQQRPERFQARSFLDRVFGAYRALAAGADATWRPDDTGAGPLVPLLDLHELLTLLPVASADYPVEEFACDLLRLDRQPNATTSQGHRFGFAAATGTKGRKRLTVFDEQGGQHEFFAIRFTLEPDDARSERGRTAT
jgi:hypothetical protein